MPARACRVLSLVFGQPERSLATTELIRLAGSGRGAVQREIDRLVSSGIIEVEAAGPQKRLRANRASPIFAELRGIVDKTAGVAHALKAALSPLVPALRLAVLYGSVAKQLDRATSDMIGTEDGLSAR